LKRFAVHEGTRRNRGVWLEKIPFCVLSLIAVVFTIQAQHAGGAFKTLESVPLQPGAVLERPPFVTSCRNQWPFFQMPEA
jgi:hypothetical protein